MTGCRTIQLQSNSDMSVVKTNVITTLHCNTYAKNFLTRQIVKKHKCVITPKHAIVLQVFLATAKLIMAKINCVII